jgi:hypothetical protein
LNKCEKEILEKASRGYFCVSAFEFGTEDLEIKTAVIYHLFEKGFRIIQKCPNFIDIFWELE